MQNNVRDRIIEAAQELFAHYGFKKTTLDDIAKASGMVKSSLYYYFKNKDEIIKIVASIEINRGKELLAKIKDSSESAAEKFANYVKTRTFVIHSLNSNYNSLEETYFAHHRLVEELRAEVDREETGTIKGLLEEGIAQGVFKVEDVELTALNLFKILKGIEHAYLKVEDGKIEKELENLIVLLLQGLIKR